MQGLLEDSLSPTGQNDRSRTFRYNEVLRRTIRALARSVYSNLPEIGSTRTFAALRTALKSLRNKELAAHYAVIHQHANIVPARFVRNSFTGETPLLSL